MQTFVQSDTPTWDPAVLSRELPEFKELPAGVIVAGGALINWAFGTSTSESDIDLWTNDRTVFVKTVNNIAAFWKACNLNPTCRTNNIVVIYEPYKVLIHRPELPDVQVMYWPRRSFEELVASFDIDACRAYTDGKNRFLHPTALRAWQTKTVYEVACNPIAAYRISKMLLKGFRVSLPAGAVIDPSITKKLAPPAEQSDDSLLDLVKKIDALNTEDPIAGAKADAELDDFWKNYHAKHIDFRALKDAVDYTFETEVIHIADVHIADGRRRIGVSVVPPALEHMHPRFLFFFNVAADVPMGALGPASLTVRVYGASYHNSALVFASQVVAWK